MKIQVVPWFRKIHRPACVAITTATKQTFLIQLRWGQSPCTIWREGERQQMWRENTKHFLLFHLNYITVRYSGDIFMQFDLKVQITITAQLAE